MDAAHVISQRRRKRWQARSGGWSGAEELVYQTLHEIVEAFRNMDDILAEINRKLIPEIKSKTVQSFAGRDGRCQRTDERDSFIY